MVAFLKFTIIIIIVIVGARKDLFAMVDLIHSYIVRPEKNIEELTPLVGVAIQSGGALFTQLRAVYDAANDECDIAIQFNPGPDGTQQNDARDALIKYIAAPSLPLADVIADRLRICTTRRSGLGLLFIMTGQIDGQSKIVLSRFPADSGILAEEEGGTLNVELVERVFMKNRTAYKSVVYNNLTATSGVWIGNAVDKQINSLMQETSGYWIKGFLNSDFRETGPAGTKRLANAIRKAMIAAKDSNVSVELLPLLNLGAQLDGQAVSIHDVLTRYNISDDAQQLVRSSLPRPEVANITFTFERVIFENEIKLKVIKLDSGAYIAAPASEFDDIVGSVDNKDGQPNEYYVQGKLVDTVIRKKI